MSHGCWPPIDSARPNDQEYDMSKTSDTHAADFKREFLTAYLQFGLGSMPKADVDALVMSLIDRYGCDDAVPTRTLSNQEVSEKLRTPLSRVRKLRYDAALKFGGDVAKQARERLLLSLTNATLESKGDKVSIVIEDVLARNWLLRLNLDRHGPPRRLCHRHPLRQGDGLGLSCV
jgi:hypothetical protein